MSNTDSNRGKALHSTIHYSIVHVILWGRLLIHRQISLSQPQNPVYMHSSSAPKGHNVVPNCLALHTRSGQFGALAQSGFIRRYATAFTSGAARVDFVPIFGGKCHWDVDNEKP